MSTTKNELLVSEQFYSLQGEGITGGMPANFLRLAKCNLMCGGAGTEKDGRLHNGATWRCDTIEVWTKGVTKSFYDIAAAMNSECRRLIITGGEPLLHQDRIPDFIDFLNTKVEQVEVETNCTIVPTAAMLDRVDQWNVSPKLFNSGVKVRVSHNAKAVDFFANTKRNVQFKFVITQPEDIIEINNYDLPRHKVWLMPGADSKDKLEEISKRVASIALVHGYNFSNRLHIALWNRKTGV